MGAWLGAIKGIWRGLLLIVVLALFPLVAWLVAAYVYQTLSLGFVLTFVGVLALEGVLGVAALFGIASEVQKRQVQSGPGIRARSAP